MPIYYGRTKDGSDMREVEGMFINPDNPDEWSSQMYPAQRKEDSRINRIRGYMARGSLTFEQLKDQISNKTCGLSRADRQYLLQILKDSDETTGS